MKRGGKYRTQGGEEWFYLGMKGPKYEFENKYVKMTFTYEEVCALFVEIKEFKPICAELDGDMA